MKSVFDFNAYSPQEIAARVESIGVTKANLAWLPLFMLALLAGAFIGLGAMSFVLVKADASLSFAVTQWFGGLVFSLGLILVVIAGAELFTGNNLLVMAWADKKITTAQLLRNWGIVFLGNGIGALGLALLLLFAEQGNANGGAVAKTYIDIAQAKINLSMSSAFFKGILCNVLVCMAIWMAMAGRSVIDKIAAIVLPIAAFVAAGFEHSIANLFFIPMAMLLQRFTGQSEPLIGLNDMLQNLIPVTAGNIVGGGFFVAFVYYVIYLRATR
ncbi:formate/nitrite transporter family protein [Ostreibacterium oceani]|uniref:Formate transporter FocA n=1 Tax=Ostreibacterium oceani TaxID=2654998 RepID=A0A6N7EU99_9GAMM|nr:formate/nitrite transporter family protein [Ostreibacterium oceani]MPV85195.1 formate transporter FocA [Ostreibacterium oceani]